MSDRPPAWFANALSVPKVRGRVTVRGVQVQTVRWGEPGKPGVVLVHGGAAHAGWWDHIGPLLATDHTVVALDLSGHGDSGRRTRYDAETWATEVIAACEAGGIEGKALLVGHSMGGWIALNAAAHYPDRVDALLVIDTPVGLDDEDDTDGTTRGANLGRSLRVYPTREEALARFRVVPAQRDALPYVIEHVAAHSVRWDERGKGWVWKFDASMFPTPRMELSLLSAVRCPVMLARAELGVLTADWAGVMATHLGGPSVIVELPQAWHHVMLDQPLMLTAVIRVLLARRSSTSWPLG